MFENVAAIIPAGGCGDLGNGRPKVLEPLPNGRSVLAQVVAQVNKIGCDPTVVVANNYKFRRQIERHMSKQGLAVLFAHQHWRLGAAEAVAMGLEKLPERKLGCPDAQTDYKLFRIDHVLVVYADKPLWRAETLKQLVSLHLTVGAKVSMLSIPISEQTPEAISQYGRILRDERGHVQEVVERQDPEWNRAEQARSVNPCLFVFERDWLDQNLSKINPVCRDDGYTPEFWLPRLVNVASDNGDKIAELPFDTYDEALGVNTAEELELVRLVITKRLEEGRSYVER